MTETEFAPLPVEENKAKLKVKYFVPAEDVYMMEECQL